MAVQISGNDITVPRDGTFTRNVTIGGTLTYEDVTNIDSVGLVTARTGIEIGARPGVAASISVDGNAVFSGVTTVGGRIDTTDSTDGALNATFTRGADANFQLQFRNHGTSNTAVSGVGSFGVFRGDNDIVGLSFMRGIGSSGAGSLGVTQAGVEKVRVYYNGHVGIGSTQPAKQLTINKAAGTNGGILVQPAAAYANDTDRAYLIAATDGWTDASTNWNTYGFQHKIKSNESGVGRVTIDTNSGEAFSVDSTGCVGIGTVTQQGKLAIGKATGAYLNNHGLVVNRPHSIGLKNGVLVYSDAGYNPTASYNAAAFKAVGTTGMAIGISTDAGSNGLGGTINFSINFDGTVNIPDGVAQGGSGSRLAIGTGQDLVLYHSGGTNFLHNKTGNLTHKGTDDAAVGVFYDNGWRVQDDKVLALGSSSDFKMKWGGTNAFILNEGADNSRTYRNKGGGVSSYIANESIDVSNYGFIIRKNVTTGTFYPIWFANGNGNRGEVSITNNTLTYSTTSDYRLKENVVSITDGITKVKQLKPKRFTWIGDSTGNVNDGFLAHEVQEVVPQAVTGEKDAPIDSDERGYQGLDSGHLIPILTAALQESITEIESLKARLDTAGL